MALCEAKGADASGIPYVVTACFLEFYGEYVTLVTVATATKDKKYTPAMKKIVASIEEDN